MNDEQIFKKGSTTYYWSSRFFPKAVRNDVFKLYSFVRVADDFIDQVPQDAKSFEKLSRLWSTVQAGTPVSTKTTMGRVVQNMYDVASRYNFDPAWTEAFLQAMRSDLQSKRYKTLDDTLGYVYGSAEVIGLMMCKVMGMTLCECHAAGPLFVEQRARLSAPQNEQAPPLNLSKLPKACRRTVTARLQGRAMQYINFIRDIAEDIELGRTYFPKSELVRHGLPALDERSILTHAAAYREFMHAQLTYYEHWQTKASKGIRFIARRPRVAVRTAVDMYNWTAGEIAKDPFVVLEKKVKPSKFRVIRRALRNALHV